LTHHHRKEPRVGIFWLLDGKLLIDSTGLSKAEEHGDFKVHPGDHHTVWEQFQQDGSVPPEMEYEEAPRGRVVYNTQAQRFSLLADRCVLIGKSIVSKIMRTMNLPGKNTDKVVCLRLQGGAARCREYAAAARRLE
jgi:hypothetical protein